MIANEEQIFSEAVDITSDEDRRAFLDQACGDEATLRQKVDQLIKMHFSAGKLLDETRDGSMCESIFVAGPKIGDAIGPYKLLQEIGDGGMGVVFMAEQSQPVRRMVAVKVIKLGMDTRSVIARFESERQALALMDHPCITKVLDAGATESGRPFFVMDLVRGKSITEYCDENQISLSQRLEIFVQVCAGVEHAHQKGIIHRDIKPSNVMVTSNDGIPLPKIIDFGIAKATDQRLTEKTLFTNYGEMVGTPLYMSPEQAEMNDADVDTRSDVYSLGVLLYELVTGSTPFDDLKSQGLNEIRQAIRSTDPMLASTRINKLGQTVDQVTRNRNTDAQSLKKFVRGELDWILAKCLARDRSHRYQSAGELARDLNRHLKGDVVEAAKPSLRYRTSKFVAKHRAAVAAAAAIALILCSSTFVSAAMAMRARNAEELAKSRLAEVAEERDRAQEAEQRLEILERQQRNNAARNQAIAMHNANMVKRHMKTVEHGQTTPVGAGIYVKPVSALWKGQTSTSIETNSDSSNQQAQYSLVYGPGSQNQFLVTGDHGSGNIEVVVMGDETTSQVELLKCLADVQRETFGSRDVTVAVTLNQLGDVLAHRQDWDESEQFYREAIEIVEDVANDVDPKYVSEMRMRLVGCLKDKGDVERAIAELNQYKNELQYPDVAKELGRLIDTLKNDLPDVERIEEDIDDR